MEENDGLGWHMGIDGPERVASSQELAEFLLALAEEMRRQDDGSRAAFVESAGGWVQDMAGYFAKMGQPLPQEPTWALVASIFAAARVYE